MSPTLLHSPTSAHNHPALPSLPRDKKPLLVSWTFSCSTWLCLKPHLIKHANRTICTSDNRHKSLSSSKKRKKKKGSPISSTVHYLHQPQQCLFSSSWMSAPSLFKTQSTLRHFSYPHHLIETALLPQSCHEMLPSLTFLSSILFLILLTTLTIPNLTPPDFGGNCPLLVPPCCFSNADVLRVTSSLPGFHYAIILSLPNLCLLSTFLFWCTSHTCVQLDICGLPHLDTP